MKSQVSPQQRTQTFLAAVALEHIHAQQQHGPMRSGHEAYAVLQEELDEFWMEVKRKHPDPHAMREELVQLAAMCVRAAVDLRLPIDQEDDHDTS